MTSPSGCDGAAGRPPPGCRTGRRRFPLQRLAGRDKDAAAPGRKTGVGMADKRVDYQLLASIDRTLHGVMSRRACLLRLVTVRHQGVMITAPLSACRNCQVDGSTDRGSGCPPAIRSRRVKPRYISLAAIAALATIITAGTPAATLAAIRAARTSQDEGFVSSQGQLRVAGSAAACGWKIGGHVSGEYESEDGVYVLAYTDSTATSVLSCPKGTSDFMFNRAQVVLNGHPKGTAKTSECTRAWCTVAVSTAIWHCTQATFCQGWYYGEGSFTISLSGGHSWPSPAPKGCRLTRDDEVIQCTILSKGGYYVPAEK